VCYVCKEDLRKWSKEKKEIIQIWCSSDMEGTKNHSDDDYYFCGCDIKGYNSKNNSVILYPKLPSALRPVVHGPEVQVTQPTEILEDASTNSYDSRGDD
jgi:hypothetical protein